MENTIYESLSNFSKFSFNEIKSEVDNFKNSCIEFKTDTSVLLEIASNLEKDSRKNVQSLALKIKNFISLRIKEIDRVKKMYDFDKSYISSGYLAGVDEVGRGPLAGPIVAASVILDLNYKTQKDLLLGIKDSKKLTSRLREELSEIIKDKAIAYSISQLENTTIDSKGIAFCNNEIFKMAVASLHQRPSLVLSDGYPIKNFNIKNNYAVKGDEKSASIACASIIAKVYRDNLMKDYSKIYPNYGFEENMGYGTKEHIEALKIYGPCEIHRKCFLGKLIINK
ncbi:ribonuclease HII [Candidatus Clostridium stratigraminis]|uniref:Ribonuclease HII n=1 Tax=Candidatus Clostridium stratigraminis TaxID=3381661 RepID=A0ABW8T4C9_9CLOT